MKMKQYSHPKVSIIAAIGAYDRAIGNNNELLWHISDDLKRFKSITERHPVIMGRKTFDSIVDYLKGPLPNRTNIVVTRDQSYSYDGAAIVHSLEDALEKAGEIEATEIFIIGGAQIYEQAILLADKIYLTLIDDRKEADVYFPEYEQMFTKKTFEEKRETKDGLKYTWVDLERA